MRVSVNVQQLFGSRSSSTGGDGGDGGAARASSHVQQPQSHAIATFEASPLPSGGRGLDVNSHFLLYAVKNGLIRVLHRTAPLKALLRGHQGQTIQDVRFFQDGDVLGTVGLDASSRSSSTSNNNSANSNSNSKSTVLIWRVFERSPGIQSDVLLEIQAPSAVLRLVWHPFNPNQFWMLHESNPSGVGPSATTTTTTTTTMATLVESTRIQTLPGPQGHAVCQYARPDAIMDGAIQVSWPNQSLIDLCWSDRDTRHVLTVFDHTIVLWDLKQLVRGGNASGGASSSAAGAGGGGVGVVAPTALAQISMEANAPPLSRCLFLPHEQALVTGTGGKDSDDNNSGMWTSCFVTGSNRNSTLTLWDAFGPNSATNPPSQIQVVSLEEQSSSVPAADSSGSTYHVECCFGPAPADASPPSCFLVLADATHPRLLALHCQAKWDNNDEKGASHNHPKPLLVGCDYVVPFQTQDPTYSMKCLTVPTTDISDEDLLEQGALIFDMKVFAYQSKSTQCLTLTSYMCLPPETTFRDPTDAVSYQPLRLLPGVGGVDVGEADDSIEFTTNGGSGGGTRNVDGGLVFDEEYDIGQDDDDDDLAALDDVQAPEPSSLPQPDGFLAGTATPSDPLANNPFANWLGAIAAMTTTTTEGTPVVPPVPPPGLAELLSASNSAAGSMKKEVPIPPPPPPPPPTPNVAPKAISSVTQQAFLSPMDILGLTPPNPSQQITPKTVVPDKAPASSQTSTPSITPPTSNRKKKPKQPPPPQPALPQQSQAKAAAAAPPPPQKEPSAILPRPSGEAPAPPQIVSREIPAAGRASGTPGISLDTDTIREIVREELQAVLGPSLSKSVQATVLSALQPVQGALDRLIEDSQCHRDFRETPVPSIDPNVIAQAVEIPLKAAMAEQVKAVWIPALDSLTNQVLSQVSDQLERVDTKINSNTNKDLEAISTQLSTMTSLVSKLTAEIQSLRATVAAQQVQQQQQRSSPAQASSVGASSGGAMPVPVAATVDEAQVARKEIAALLHEKSYEAAFTRAVTFSREDMAAYCCANANVQAVLGGATPALSQPILLCLMQQLGTALSGTKADIQLELLWLQEVALSLNPSDAHIHPHVPAVLQQLVSGINVRMGRGDPILRRPLQRLLQVVRGMQMG